MTSTVFNKKKSKRAKQIGAGSNYLNTFSVIYDRYNIFALYVCVI